MNVLSIINDYIFFIVHGSDITLKESFKQKCLTPEWRVDELLLETKYARIRGL